MVTTVLFWATDIDPSFSEREKKNVQEDFMLKLQSQNDPGTGQNSFKGLNSI